VPPGTPLPVGEQPILVFGRRNEHAVVVAKTGPLKLSELRALFLPGAAEVAGEVLVLTQLGYMWAGSICPWCRR